MDDENIKDIDEVVEETTDSIEETKSEVITDVEALGYKQSKRLLFTIIFCIVLFSIMSGTYLFIRHKKMTLHKSNIFVCDNSKEYSQFDDWIMEDLGVDWVPTFLVFRDGKYVGMIRGTINVYDFKSELGTALIYSKNTEVPDYYITNIKNETKSVKELVAGKDLCFIEVSWLDCPDCVDQEKLNPEIYAKYDAANFYIYYIKSTMEDVSNHYN